MNVFNFDRLYRRTKTGVGVAGQVVRLRLNPIGPKTLRVLTHVTVENLTDTTDEIRLGIDHVGVLHYLDELKNVIAGELAVSRSDILLGEGDSFFAELTGTHDPDQLIMTCIGWEQKL